MLTIAKLLKCKIHAVILQ